MFVGDTLQQIKRAWISRVSQRLAKGEGTRLLFRVQLDDFYQLLIQAIGSADPLAVNGLLDDWIQSRTQTDVELQKSTLIPILEQFILVFYEIATENLDHDIGLQTLGAILPVLTHAIGYTTQVEARLYLDQVLQQQEKSRISLERLERSKSDFIAIAAHELRTPLTLIEGYSAMLRESFKDGTGHEQDQILIKGIENGTQRLRQIVDDMIDVSMIDNQLLELKYQPVRIDRLLELVLNEFRETATSRNIALGLNPFPGSQEMTFGDEERLYQALQNVLSNAIKFTPDGGAIHIDGRLLPGFVEVIVTDTGIGIDPANHALIFEKFGRLGEASRHSSGKTKFKGGGPGLGLPITKGILEAHGGTIWVESEGYDEVKYPGSKFHILLPIRKRPPDEKMAKLFRTSIETGELKDPYH